MLIPTQVDDIVVIICLPQAISQLFDISYLTYTYPELGCAIGLSI
jgi:hypothetical protein